RYLMYLTASRPDIMFAVCACARHQVTPKECHLHAVKRIFRYLKGHSKLGLWYPKASPFDLVAYSNSDYGGASQDRKSTTGGKYVVVASCCGQVMWIQNQLLDYGYNFMNTKIYLDNNSAICIVKNPVYHSKTKHIEIRHHFIRDSFEKKVMSVDHIHTDKNVADLLTKAFDAGRFQYLVTDPKKKLQEQIDAQVARELEEQQEKENMRTNEQIARDAEVARIHAEEELQGMIDSLDNNLGWRLKDFKGMIFEEIEPKFAEVWKQVEDFIPIGSKEETERLKRKGLNIEKEQVKKQKLSEEAPEIETSTKEFNEEKMKEMMQLRGGDGGVGWFVGDDVVAWDGGGCGGSVVAEVMMRWCRSGRIYLFITFCGSPKFS
nr:hypothetical protein [Tanacetum cinerariifolium]